MRIGLLQTARMEQRLLQSPRLIQAMQILQLSSLDLEQRIERELLENPLLEREEGRNVSRPRDGAGRGVESAPRSALDHVLAMRERDRRDPALLRRRGPVEAQNRKHEALQNTPESCHSLGESLLCETALLELDDRRRAVLEFLLYSLDPRGYLPVPLELLARDCGIEGASEEEFREILTEVRRATHPAMGARDLTDCLLLQVNERAHDSSLLRTLITDHLRDVAANRLPHIARATSSSMEEVAQAIELLRMLSPFPASAYGGAPAEVIRPELVVEERDGSFHVRLTRGGSPEPRIASAYQKLLREVPRGDPARKWIRERLGAARSLLDALEQRRTTLLQVACAVFERQAAFLESGRKALRPLRMLEIADDIGIHVSTVSRAVAGKHAQTPHGILPLRSFFSGGIALAAGGAASQSSVYEQMKRLVAEEDPRAPLSDRSLAMLLRERDGISLARRTVTKYRRALDIASARERRVF